MKQRTCVRTLSKHGETTVYLQQLGWNSEWEKHFSQIEIHGCIPARVAEENREIYKVFSEAGELLAELAGKIRFQAQSRRDFPAVGDWVLISPRLSEGRATIETILPRKSALLRKAAGKEIEEQVIAANIDTIFLTTSLNQDFNLRRMERYLAIAWESGSTPVVLLNKADLCSDPDSFQQRIANIAPGVPVHAISALTGAGISQLSQYLQPGSTAAFIGSSGAGKSTIINALAGRTLQRVEAIREWDDRGRHTTTTRQMMLLPEGGGIVIDTPGLREIGMWESAEGVSRAFEEIEELASGCRFRDCRHSDEPGCAVLEAVKDRTLSGERLENYRKLTAELRFQESKSNIRIRQAKKAYWKRVSKSIKKLYNDRNR